MFGTSADHSHSLPVGFLCVSLFRTVAICAASGDGRVWQQKEEEVAYVCRCPVDYKREFNVELGNGFDICEECEARVLGVLFF